MSRDSAFRRQSPYNAKLEAMGLRQVVVWVPEDRRDDVHEAAREIRRAAGIPLPREREKETSAS